MKKTTFSLVVLAVFITITSKTFAQNDPNNPCPSSDHGYIVNTVSNGNGMLTSQLKIHHWNDVGDPNPKSIGLEMFVNGIHVFDDCFLSSPAANGAYHLSPSFTYPVNAQLDWTITYRTASNTQCQGGICKIYSTFSTLPVSFKSFSATRKNSNVLLKWETASEENNTGFAIECKTTGDWKKIAFVSSQALNGNSDASLSYVYNDVSYEKGISQYRIRQVDFDQKSKYSEIKMVKGQGQANGVIVYPNPAIDGKVNVVLEDGIYSVALMGVSGQTVGKWTASNSLQISNLNSGMYLLKTANSAGQQEIKKIIVQ